MADVRAVANVVLRRADQLGIGVSNMALNKVVYFVHCDHLVEKGAPLVGAKIEAWKHGPVFRELYHQFKRWDDYPIKAPATKVNPSTGGLAVAEPDSSIDLVYLTKLIDRYIHFTAAQLRAISHIEGGPWHVVWDHDGEANPGMQISNEIIRDHYSPGRRQ